MAKTCVSFILQILDSDGNYSSSLQIGSTDMPNSIGMVSQSQGLLTSDQKAMSTSTLYASMKAAALAAAGIV